MKNTTPAVLWYSQDFITGTADMTMEERGVYVTLLCFQNTHGHMSREFIERICPNCPEYVLDKFLQDEDGEYYNERMEAEIQRRVKYSESRSRNVRSKSQENSPESSPKDISKTYQVTHDSTYEEHMETETEIYIEKDKNKKKGSGEKEKEKKEVSATAEAVISHLNFCTGKQYRASSKQARAKIEARMNEGYTLDDFIKVIDIKATEWMGSDMEKYLRPETLFGPKFEGYLNQRPARREMSNVEIAMMLDEAERRSNEPQPDWSDAGEGICSLPEYVPRNG